jgi:hypothetical protein
MLVQRMMLVGVALLLATTPSLAQVHIHPGVRVGANFANFYGDTLQGMEDRRTFHAGAFARIAFDSPFAIQPEVLYARKGMLDDNVRLTRVEYLQFNGLVHVRLPFGTRVRPTVTAGPALSIKLLEAFENEGQRLRYLDPQFKKRDVSGIIGGGVDIESAHGTFLIDMRYEMGFRNVLLPEYVIELKNRVMAVSVGFMF